MKIGLLGGTFNPIHYGHLHIAERTCERIPLDQILFIPSADPPHKSQASLAPASHRLAMVQAAVSTYPKFSVSDIELRFPGKSYTYETIHRLRQELEVGTDLFFLVGLDAFLEFENWKEAPDLLRSCHFIVVSRASHNFAQLATLSLLPELPPKDLQALDNHQRDRLDIPLSPTTTLILLSLPPCDISASVIRKHIKEGRPVSHWLPASVESYIIQHRLYQINMR